MTNLTLILLNKFRQIFQQKVSLQSRERVVDARAPSFDLSRSNIRVASTFSESLDYKEFTIRRAESQFESTITISKENIDQMFQKIHSKYKMKKGDLVKIVIEFKLFLSNGAGKSLYINNDEDKIENLKSFYCKMEELSTTPLIIHLKSVGGREIRPVEIIYKSLMVKNFSADIKFYQMFVDILILLLDSN